jgi:hypothetical protein
MTPRTLNSQHGIALGPILFIIAILAILAAAIAAGVGSFTANTSAESDKAMAEVIINSGHAYQDSLNLMLHNGCDPTLIDWTPNGGLPTGATWSPADYTGGNGTNHSGNGSCAMFDLRGGGMMFKPLPATAIVPNPTGAYTINFSGDTASINAMAGYPLLASQRCFKGQGVCGSSGNNNNSAIYVNYYYITYNVCYQINKIVGNNIDPNSTLNNMIKLNVNLYNNQNVITNGYTGANTQIFFGGSTQLLEGCAYDGNSNNGNSAYIYTYGMMIR